MNKPAAKIGSFSSMQDSQNLHWLVRADLQGYQQLAARIKSLIGVDMPPTEKNRTLMACRLVPILRKASIRSYGEYDNVLAQGDLNLVREFISVLTTHTTEFFRESKHFDLFPAIVSQIMKYKRDLMRPEFRLWCAAASSGQEPYTMLMSLLETPERPQNWGVKFLATDIDRVPLLKASQGKYSALEVQKIPAHLRERYFGEVTTPQGRIYEAKHALRKMITFAEFNLAIPQYPFKYPFDIVFCRNVLIYFTVEDGGKVIDRIADTLRVGGFLFVGHSETGFVRSKNLRMIAPAVFQRV